MRLRLRFLFKHCINSYICVFWGFGCSQSFLGIESILIRTTAPVAIRSSPNLRDQASHNTSKTGLEMVRGSIHWETSVPPCWSTLFKGPRDPSISDALTDISEVMVYQGIPTAIIDRLETPIPPASRIFPNRLRILASVAPIYHNDNKYQVSLEKLLRCKFSGLLFSPLNIAVYFSPTRHHPICQRHYDSTLLNPKRWRPSYHGTL